MSRSISKNINNSDKQQREPGGNWGVRSEVVVEEEEEEWKRDTVPPPTYGRETEIRRTRRASERANRTGQRKTGSVERERVRGPGKSHNDWRKCYSKFNVALPSNAHPLQTVRELPPLRPHLSPSNPINCTLPRHSFASRRWISSLLPITFSRNYFTTFRHDVQTERTER